MTEKLGLWPLFFQKCQHLGIKVNALDFALFLEATATVGSGLQLEASLLSLLLHIIWQHHLIPLRHLAERCGSAVPVCLFAPLPLQVKSSTAYLWFHLHFPFGGCFS